MRQFEPNFPTVSRVEVLNEIKQVYLDPSPKVTLSSRYERLGFNDKALLVKDIAHFLKSAPGNMPEQFLEKMDDLAGSLFRSGRQEHAEALLVAVMNKAKESSALLHAKAHLALADHYQYRLLDDRAIQHYETARELMSLFNADTRLDLVAPLECLALLHGKNGSIPKMVACYEEIRDICDAASDSSDTRAVFGLADLLKSDFIRSQPDEVEKIALNALKRMHDVKFTGIKAETLMALGDHYLSQGKDKLARTIYTQAKDLLSNPNFKLSNHYPKILLRLRERLAKDAGNFR